MRARYTRAENKHKMENSKRGGWKSKVNYFEFEGHIRELGLFQES